MKVAEIRMLRWISGHTRRGRIRNKISGTRWIVVEKMREARLSWFGHVNRRCPSEKMRCWLWWVLGEVKIDRISIWERWFDKPWHTCSLSRTWPKIGGYGGQEFGWKVIGSRACRVLFICTVLLPFSSILIFTYCVFCFVYRTICSWCYFSALFSI